MKITSHRFIRQNDKNLNAYVIHPFKKARASQEEACLDEAVKLTAALHLTVCAKKIVPLSRLNPATLLGQGIVEECRQIIDSERVALVIINSSLTPVQQRNLERAWQCKVIDRTGLILEIFGARARTEEGKLQVELASLMYQRSRLVRSWTHLERQRGGFGFLGGPGESQLEMDRRLIDERLVKIKNALLSVVRTRGLHHQARQKVPYLVVALVGYTNAGKSTLFNRLTNADVVATDQLFATLDPTMRRVALPSGQSIILSDTVGFISDLPTSLIAAFRATLETVISADLIIHVRDITHPQTDKQNTEVQKVLKELGIDLENKKECFIELWNKIDLLEAEKQNDILQHTAQKNCSIIAQSALYSPDFKPFLNKIEKALRRNQRVLTVKIPTQDGATLAWLYRHGQILQRRDRDDFTHLKVKLSPVDADKFHHQHHLPGPQGAPRPLEPYKN